MSYIRPAKLQPVFPDKMEAVVKALVEANLQQREANKQQQETNQLLLQQVMALQATGASQYVHDARKAVRAAIPKMTPSDDVETYLAVFEKVAVREKLPREQWAEDVAPFLASGPQQVFFDLPDDQAADYPTVKGEILARLGVNVLVRAQRVHQWEFSPAEPARPQYYDLLQRLQKWLQPDILTPTAMLDRLLADVFWRALPYPLQHWIGQVSPGNALEMVDLVERYEATRNLQGGSFGRGPVKPRKSPPQTRRPAKPAWDVPLADPSPVVCWQCREPGHIRADCPHRGEPMDTNYGYRHSLYARKLCATGFSETIDNSHLCQVEVGDTLAVALLDSGSLVSLVRAALVRPTEYTGRKVGVVCIHGDLKDYPTALVSLSTVAGRWVHEVAVATKLQYELIIGRDFPGFPALWPDTKVTTAREADGTLAEWPGSGGRPEPWEPETEGPAVRVTTTSVEEGEITPLNVMVGDVEDLPPGPELADLNVSGENFGTAQHRDPTLSRAWENVIIIDGEPQKPGAESVFPRFVVHQGMLYRVNQLRGEHIEQLVVPKAYRKLVLELAHQHVLGGHLGWQKTQDRILQRFYWPSVFKEVELFCKSCPTCQITSPQPHFRSPLVPLPIIEVPFERIAMDLIGPVPKSARGHQHILVVLDYATRYPEAVPLRHTSAKLIAKELMEMFSRVGLPKEVLTDQGTPFMSKVMRELCKLLHIKQLRTSVYHPQTDGLVERFNKTLKNMLKRVVAKDGKDWDLLLPYLMFAVREVPQASTGFSPFELLMADTLGACWISPRKRGNNSLSPTKVS